MFYEVENNIIASYLSCWTLVKKIKKASLLLIPSKVYTNMKKKIEWALVFALIVSGIGFVCLYAAIAIWLGAEVHI